MVYFPLPNLCALSVVTFVVLSGQLVVAQNHQPKAIVTVEQTPGSRVVGSISMAEGSPWCNGRPAYWLVGHHADDAPWCLVTDLDTTTTDFTSFNYAASQWELSSVTRFDRQDELNAANGSAKIKRRDCVTVDLNQDNVPDIVCGVDTDKNGRGTMKLVTRPYPLIFLSYQIKLILCFTQRHEILPSRFWIQ
jgi:hypothetical protein